MFIQKLIPMACLTAVLGFSAPSTAQVTDAIKHAGQATADAGKKVGTGVKHGAQTVGHETNRVVTGAPKATGRCRDGTYTNSTARSSACSRHGGVSKWYY
jgi:hypothetical protein